MPGAIQRVKRGRGVSRNSVTYRFWLEALRLVTKERGKGFQAELARKVGISRVHLNDILGGRKGASLFLQEVIAEALGFKYEEMVAAGRMLVELEEEPFPGYRQLLIMPRKERFERILEAVQRELGSTVKVVDEALRGKYERGLIDEVELYRKVKEQISLFDFLKNTSGRQES